MHLDIALRFLGHAACQISHGGHQILIDPFITGNPSAGKAGISVDDLHPTHILLTHGHDDHVGDTVALAERTGATVVAVVELATWLKEEGCPNVIGMNLGGSHDLPFGRITYTVAHHSSATPGGRYLGNPAGIVLAIGGRRIYHAGDTALFSDMRLIGRRHPLDVALVPIGDFFTMGIDDAVDAVAMLGPRIAIPIHYDTFPPIAVDANEFVMKVEASGHRAMVLHPGESYELPEGHV